MKKGLLIVFSGPSGVGKGTIIKELMNDENLNLVYSISMTTRAPREGEVDGVNYFFVSKERFNEAIYNDELLEHACFVDNFYGTPKAYVEKMRNEGKNVLLEIETVGAKQVMNHYEDDKGCVSVFIVPPSIEELESRIRGRKTESEEVIKKRIFKATQELRETYRYQHVVCNDNIENAVMKVKDIINKSMEDYDEEC
ncbi:MAG: guanylate kinase [Erysipelotrichaceae bacterium]|nr:guanylate kinase [Bacillota bacterium]MDY3092227.1 guanylate kinase [Erysipelotrichaceae bacterium]